MAAPFAQAEGSLEAVVSKQDVIEGDAFRLSVVYSGSDDPEGAPVFSVPDAAPMSGPSTEQSVSIFNGARSSRRAWRYIVQPEGTGVVSFGTASLRVGGKDLRAPVPPVRVGSPPPQSWVRLSLQSDKAEVLVEERFTVSLVVELRLPKGGADPFSETPLIPGEPPRLMVPHLAGADPGSCAPDEDVSENLMGLRVSGKEGGFTVNEIRERAPDPFASMGMGGFGGFPSMSSMFDAGSAAVFAPRPERFSEGGTNFVRYVFPLRYRATAEGVCRFAGSRFEGHVATSDGGSLVRSDDFTALAAPLVVRVVPPPAEGRPDSFFGALGTSLAPAVTLDAQTCRQGDPLQLTLALPGDLVPATIRAPDLFSIPAFAELFRGWGEPERTTKDGAPAFAYKVRPLVAGTIEIPAIPLSWYDTEKRAYRTVLTDPVPLRVDPVAGFDAAVLFANAEDAPPDEGSSFSASSLPSALSFDPAGALPAPPFPRRAAAFVLALPPAIWALVRLALAFALRRRSLFAALRRGSARGRAASRLRAAESPRAALEAVRLLLRDRFGVDRPGLTPGDVREILAARGADPATTEEAARLLQEIFDESFRPGADVAAAVRARRGRLADLLSSLRTVVILLGLGLAVSASGAEPSGDTFAWRRACASAAFARTPEAFTEAAARHRAIAEQGGGNAVLFGNYGALLLLAGEPEAAYDAFLRAEALSGTTPELRHDFAAAAAARPPAAGSAAPAPAVRRRATELALAAPPAWRRGAFAVSWSLLWLAILLRRVPRLRGLAGAVIALALLVCALCAFSEFSARSVLSASLPEQEAQP